MKFFSLGFLDSIKSYGELFKTKHIAFHVFLDVINSYVGTCLQCPKGSSNAAYVWRRPSAIILAS